MWSDLTAGHARPVGLCHVNTRQAVRSTYVRMYVCLFSVGLSWDLVQRRSTASGPIRYHREPVRCIGIERSRSYSGVLDNIAASVSAITLTGCSLKAHDRSPDHVLPKRPLGPRRARASGKIERWNKTGLTRDRPACSVYRSHLISLSTGHSGLFVYNTLTTELRYYYCA